MITYLQNGTLIDLQYFLNDDDGFAIQEVENINITYTYPGDSVFHKVNYEIVTLYDIIRNHFFCDIEEYYEQLTKLPIYVQELGLSSLALCSKNEFAQLIEKSKITHPYVFKHLYLCDVQFILNSIQNLVIGMNYNLIEYFRMLSKIEAKTALKDGEYAISGENSIIVTSILSAYFVKAHSILDLITKIAFELQSDDYDFNRYPNLKCAKILYGDKKRLNMDKCKGTLFERSDLICEIESIRDEIIHNGCWELNSKIYMRAEDNRIIERYLLYPDMIDGHYGKYVNRYHFFSMGKKVNDVLPLVHLSFLNRLLTTIIKLSHPIEACESSKNDV